MAENDTAISPYPPPPMHYVSRYTDENIKSNRAPKPPPSVKDSYTIFGKSFSANDQIIVPLEAQHLHRLHPQNYDHKRELKKLNYSVLVCFLDLIEVLVRAADSQRRVEKIQDLNLLFIHMHHLINEFRPHQARETLRVLLEQQKRQRLAIADRFNACLAITRELVKTSINSLPDDTQLDSKLLIDLKITPTENPTSETPLRQKIESMASSESMDLVSDENGGEEEKAMCDLVDDMV